ncbi:hypothetical protein BXZ70DRAFT_919588 [Cristinia sonorae]|uniref:CCHC-type domain-containing protein n=1 Tax=Cristinia sonorae TaxID=1940300 RepID=A0A8K0XTD6_9AGAR|nr:hypothetical protein BXZ70DRAFT_919588 [Cristinia sonorae]
MAGQNAAAVANGLEFGPQLQPDGGQVQGNQVQGAGQAQQAHQPGGNGVQQQAGGDDQQEDIDRRPEPEPAMTLALINARIAELEALEARRARPSRADLMVDDTEAATARASAASLREEQVTPLPPVVAGFRADPLESVVPPAVDKAVRKGLYVPYDALTRANRVKAHRGEEEIVLHPNGSASIRGLSRDGEKYISLEDWLAASHTVEALVRTYHGDARADCLKAHHMNVRKLLGQGLSWSQTCLPYDIHQRELWAAEPRHDISQIDANHVSLLVATSLQASQLASQSTTSSHPTAWQSSKRRAQSPPPSQPSSKKPKTGGYCFRCGKSGHLPGTCGAETTVAGKPCAAITTLKRGGTALTAPGGKTYCFRFASTASCKFNTDCINFHGCSICLDEAHGAASCPRCR